MNAQHIDRSSRPRTRSSLAAIATISFTLGLLLSPSAGAQTANPTPRSADASSTPHAASTNGYWMVGSDGGVFGFGGAPYQGSLPALGIHVNNIKGIVPTSDGKGYWLVGSDGGVFALGDAGFVGSIPGLGIHINNIVGAVSTSDGKGYWMIGADGGVFAFGDAGFVGSVPGLGIHVKNVVAVVPTHDSRGYWMIGSDGGIFSFGDAKYFRVAAGPWHSRGKHHRGCSHCGRRRLLDGGIRWWSVQLRRCRVRGLSARAGSQRKQHCGDCPN